VLLERIMAIVCHAEDAATSDPPPLLPYITDDLLSRLANLVSGLTLEERRGWCTHSLLGKVVASITDGKRSSCRKDYEYPGNQMHRYVKEAYLPELRLAQRGAAASARKALKAGKDPPQYTRLATAKERQYICHYGCTPHTIMLPPASTSAPAPALPPAPPLHVQEVPWTAHDPREHCHRLETERGAAQKQADAEKLSRESAEKQKKKAESCAAQSEAGRQAAEERTTAERQQKEEVQQQLKDVKQDLRQQQKASAKAMKKLEAENLVLGGQIANVIREASRDHKRAEAAAAAAAVSRGRQQRRPRQRQ
jgi:hypothetical protein